MYFLDQHLLRKPYVVSEEYDFLKSWRPLYLGIKERIIREVNFTVTILVFLHSHCSLATPSFSVLNCSLVPATRKTWKSAPPYITAAVAKPVERTCLQQFAFKYETIMKCPGGNSFCSSSCSTDTGIQKQEPNRLTILHNIISVACNLFSTIIRYLERET